MDNPTGIALFDDLEMRNFSRGMGMKEKFP
jgi:hypothetical protein